MHSFNSIYCLKSIVLWEFSCLRARLCEMASQICGDIEEENIDWNENELIDANKDTLDKNIEE